MSPGLLEIVTMTRFEQVDGANSRLRWGFGASGLRMPTSLREPVSSAVAHLGRWTEVRVSPLRIRCSSFLPQTHAGQMRVRDAMSASDGWSEMNCVSVSESRPRIRCISAGCSSQPVKFVVV